MKKAKELDQPGAARPASDDCPVCRRRPDRVYEDQVWKWAKANPGVSPWRT